MLVLALMSGVVHAAAPPIPSSAPQIIPPFVIGTPQFYWGTTQQAFFMGPGAGASYPTTAETFGVLGIGAYAMASMNVIGSESTGIGNHAGWHSTGALNAFIGNYAGGYEVGASGDTAIGNDVMRDSISSAGFVTAIGQFAVGNGSPAQMVGVGNSAGAGASAAIAFGGTVTVGDTLTVTISASGSTPTGLTGLPLTKTVTAVSGDTILTMATRVAVGLDEIILGPGLYDRAIITDTAPDGTVILRFSWPGTTLVGWALNVTTSQTGAATETMVVNPGTSYGGGSVFVGPFSGQGPNAFSPLDSTGVGGYTLQNLTIGSYNTAVGWNAGNKLTNGIRNTFVGNIAGSNSVNGSYNTFVGDSAGTQMQATTFSNYATGLGQNAGNALTTGGYSLFLGANAGATYPTTGQTDIIINSGSGACNTDAANTSDEMVICGGNTTPFFKALKTNVPASTTAAFTGSLNTGGYTVSGLATAFTSPTVGMRAYVTDATACGTFMGTLTGGGSTYCPVNYNGSAWVQGG
jgi:hypothetical protein